MNKCLNCGAMISNTDKFCQNCGANLTSNDDLNYFNSNEPLKIEDGAFTVMDIFKIGSKTIVTGKTHKTIKIKSNVQVARTGQIFNISGIEQTKKKLKKVKIVNAEEYAALVLDKAEKSDFQTNDVLRLI